MDVKYKSICNIIMIVYNKSMAQRIATTTRMKTDSTGGAISVVAIRGGKAKR